jgi:hypothetical protein
VPTATYEKIATYTAPSAVTSYTFSVIPGTYTDIVLVINGGFSTATTGYVSYRVNGDTGSNYSYTRLYGDGTSALSGRNTNKTLGAFDIFNSGTEKWMIIAQFMNYSNATTYKTTLSRQGNGATLVGTLANLWRNTAAITSITLLEELGLSFATGTTFTLYGIKAA